MLSNKKSPNEIDFEIGRRIKLRRNALGLNQQQLAREIDVSYQQVQKYENGTDRVGAARLFQISQALDVPIGFFYGSLIDGGFGTGEVVSLEDHQIQRALADPDGRQLLLIFANLKVPSLRTSLLDIAKSLADTDKYKKG
ncbi:MAG: Cro/C1 type transcriptional regulator [Saliniramus fredricksonii]|jgi:transcriptional regulator with XRE-family HTH domain|uniref:Cro/C1 type transcriptional regulator n=1 Tax=Saliniramus fredricksonii TaxID=1653334 RepID=A0A0P7Y5H1_9HYPH|nr:MAG: Cro/C1 type transcriptional regulator [Saliniramus fredricksonii]SCC81274.1 Helix-turn-helix [Saliniramus fredricksonii]